MTRLSTHRPPHTAHCPLHTAHRPLLTAHSPLSTAHCPAGWPDLLADRSSGAQAIALRALDLALTSRLPLRQLRVCFRELARSHPAMAMLANLERKVCRARTRRRLAELQATLRRSNDVIARNFRRRLAQHFPGRRDIRVLTFSHSATVLAVLEAARQSIGRVRIARSLPLGEGVIACRAARKAGSRASVFADDRLPDEVGKCDLVVVGADSLMPDGSIVNKIGTRTLARAAIRLGKPFWVVTSRYKFGEAAGACLFQTVRGQRIKLFDITPAEWIDLVITE